MADTIARLDFREINRRVREDLGTKTVGYCREKDGIRARTTARNRSVRVVPTSATTGLEVGDDELERVAHDELRDEDPLELVAQVAYAVDVRRQLVLGPVPPREAPKGGRVGGLCACVCL